jgi:UDP-2-acetamido-3-amino-2,3-dideoxy-glucuronate N-acetyltransferase
MAIHDTAQIEDSAVEAAEVREYVTIHDSTLAADVRIYERTSIKKSTIEGPTDVNANCYVENATLGSRVQVGPNAAIVGVTHDLGEDGMTFGDDRFEEVVVQDGGFVGAGATVLPGVTIGRDAVVGAGTTVTADVPAETVVRTDAETTQRPL